MSRFMSAPAKIACFLAGGATSALLTIGAATGAQSAAIPDFQSGEAGWIATLNDLGPPASGPGPVTFDKAHPYVPNNRGAQPTWRIADIGSPILKPWAAQQMRQANEKILAGGIAFTPRSSCMPAGVPGFSHFIVEPIYIVQSPKEVLMVYSGDQQVRRIHMNVPHSRNPKPSWYGESVGRYENGDTLVVDTIGFNAKTFVDNYRTPHTEKLHVEERYRIVDGGRMLQVDIRIEDPDAFNSPWSGVQRYRRVEQGPLHEEVCAENNTGLFDYNIPQAGKPDF